MARDARPGRRLGHRARAGEGDRGRPRAEHRRRREGRGARLVDVLPGLVRGQRRLGRRRVERVRRGRRRAVLELRRARHRRDDGVALDDRQLAAAAARAAAVAGSAAADRAAAEAARAAGSEGAQPSAVIVRSAATRRSTSSRSVVERARDADEAPRRVGRLGGRDRPRPDRDLDREPVVDRRLERVGVERRRLVPAPAPPSGPSPGSGSATIEPSIDVRRGHRRAEPSARDGPPAPRSASSWFRAMTAGQPPSTSPPIVLERRGHGEPRRRVERALPVELGPVTGSLPRRRRGAFAPCEIVARPDPGLAVAPDVEEGRALRRADPLVEVAAYHAAPERVEVERQHPRGVRPVDERVDPAVGERRDDPLDREDERGRARDVADEREPGSIGDRRRGSRSTTSSSEAAGNGSRATTTRAPSRSATWRSDVEDRVVLVVVGEELVAGLEPERADDRVDARRSRSRRSARSSGSAPTNAPSRPAHLGEEAGEVAGEELDRLRARAGRATRAGRRGPSVGQAPNEPWLRNVTSGSSAQWRASGDGIARMMAGTLRGRWVPSTRWTRSSSC